MKDEATQFWPIEGEAQQDTRARRQRINVMQGALRDRRQELAIAEALVL